MTGKIKRRSLRCGGRPKADFGSIFTTFIAPALGVAGSVADSSISKAQASKSNIKPAVKETNTEVTNNNTSVENLPTTQAPTKEPISGLVTSNTVIPPDPTKTPTMRLGGRKKCWIGAAIMGATSIAGSLFGAAAQKREMRRQKSIKDWQDTTQEAANMTSALNNSQDYQEDYLRQFRTAARLGKRLGAKGIYITDGGDATKIDNNTYLLRGGSHEDVNETGQTGIGINVGGNEVEAEGGEVAQKKNGALRIFSAQPILNNGMSPAQAILRGYNKDKVFNQQQAFKKRNGLKDDGSKAAFGDLVTGTWNFLKQHRSPITNLAALAAAYQKFYPNSNYNKQKGKFGGGKGFNGSGAGGSWTNVKPATRKFNNFNDAYDDAVNRGASTFKFGNKLYNTKAEGNPIREINNRAVGSYRDTIMTNDRGKNYGVDFGPIKGPATLIPLVYDTYDRPRKIHRLGGGLTSKDRGSSKHPYPSVSSKDFAGGGRSYPIPTKADAVDALRLAGLHGRSDVKAKVYSRYPELRKKAEIGTVVPGGIPGTDSYKQRMYSGYDVSPADLLNLLEYLDRAAGYVDEDGNSRYITGIAPSPGIVSRAKILKGVQEANRVAQAARASQSAQRTSYTVKQAKAFYRDLGINIPVGRSRIYNPTFRSSEIAERVKESNNAFNIYSNNTHLPKGIRLTPTDKSSIGRTAARVINPREAEIVRMGIPIGESAKNMTNGANPFLYTPRNSNEVLEGLNRVIRSAGQKVKGFGNKVANPNTYRTRTGFEERYNPNIGAYEQYNTYKLKPWVKGAARSAGVASAMGIGVGLAKINSKNENTKAQLDAHGKPISQYIARPQAPAPVQAPAKQPSRTQVKKTVPTQKDIVIPRQIKKVVPQKSNTVPSRVNTTPQYKGNVTKGNYQLHDGETRTINGIKYTRRGNTIINHKTNVAYVYDKRGNYTGQADYSKVGNFNQAFDAARAAGRKDFIYRAGKYQNYSTNKETDAKKERLNRIIGARRMAKSLGGYSRPVEGMRPKGAIGIHVPFNKRYTSIYDAPDYDDINGGNALGNNEVTVTAKRIKPTFLKPNNDAMDIINHPANGTPYIPQKHNRSRTIFSGGDYLGLGIDTLAALSTGLVNYNTAGKYVLPDRAPIIQASKLPTTYNVAPEIEEVKRYRDRLTGETYRNTSSSVAALNRGNTINLDALSNISKLWATKENEENKMLTQDALNQQTVATQNVQNEIARQSEIARIENEANQAKGEALNVGLSGLSQAWTNFWTAGRTAYEDDQTRRAMIASSKEATPTRLMEKNFDLSPDVIASLYKTAKDDRTKRFYLSRLSPKQRQKYGIN